MKEIKNRNIDISNDPLENGVYHDVFTIKLKRLQGESFLLSRYFYKDIDVEWFINTWMKSRIRLDMDFSGIKWRNRAPHEVIDSLIEEVNGYSRGSDKYLGNAHWIGYMYSFFQWKFGVLSSELIDIISVKWLADRYILHECGFDVAAEKIIELSDYRHGIKTKYIETGRKEGYLRESDCEILLSREKKINEWIANDPYIQGTVQDLE